MTHLVFDIETNGFLDELDRVHCLVLRDVETGKRLSCSSQADGFPIQLGINALAEADVIEGHNVIGFDVPALFKVYGFDPPRSKVKDTMVKAKLYAGNIKDHDYLRWKKKNFPGELIGRHSLKAWGIRLGDHKGDYQGGWDTWNEEMQHYCEQDVEVTEKLRAHLAALGSWPKAEDLEHGAAWLCDQIERNGVPFDEAGAASLYAELCQLRSDRAEALKELFPPWVIYQGEKVSKANNSKTGHTIGAVYSKVLINEFNPQSRDHIADRFKTKYGWQPTAFTDGGKPQVDEKVLGALDYPEAKPLAELFLIQKRVAQIAEGKESWLSNVKDGFAHYRLNPNGAVTGRATHSGFNVTQVPKVGSKWGKECRSLFGLIEAALRKKGLWKRWSKGVLFGTDVAGLELRALAHFMSRYDDGAYGIAVVEGKEADGTDVHSLNAKALGLDPQGVYVITGKQRKGRDAAKTFIYAFLYGAGDEKIGVTVGVSDDEIAIMLTHGKQVFIAKKRLNREGRKPTKRLLATLIKGAITKAQFLEKTPALKSLQEAVQKACKRGHLIALDGRHVHVRSPHAALNTLLQGAGALVCKKWMIETERLMLAEGLKHGWDGDFAILIWAHDELQIACRTPEIAEIADRCSKQAIKLTEAYFGFRVPLDCSGKTGRTWADTH